MRISTSIISLLLPVAATAQDYQGMSERDMQNMMQQMQEMQTCMQDIDQSRMEALEQRANTIEAEVNALCANGKRDDAQQKAMAFGQEVTNDPGIQIMMKCGEKMRGMIPKVPFLEQADEPGASNRHVCDQ